MIRPAQVSVRVAEFVDTCRRQGIKVTHQRIEILRELACTDEHPDAETVYERVRERLPVISLDTVYRTLRLLEERGAIARVGSLGDRARFDANTDRHHHYVCSECGLVRDFYSEELDGFTVPPDVSELGQVDAIHIELRGRCRECKAKGREDGPAS